MEGYQEARDGGADDCCDLPYDDIERESVGQVVAGHEVGDKSRAGGVVEDDSRGGKGADDVDEGRGDQPEYSCQGQRRRRGRHDGLRDHQEAPAVEGIGYHAAEEGQAQDGEEVEEAQQTDGGGVVSEVPELHAHSHDAHLAAHLGDKAAAPEEAEVAVLKGKPGGCARNGRL